MRYLRALLRAYGRTGKRLRAIRAEWGRIVEWFPDLYLVACPISVETMPMLHYYPGAKFLQISTTGCNFNCEGCISTVIVREMSPESYALKHLTPRRCSMRPCGRGAMESPFS